MAVIRKPRTSLGFGCTVLIHLKEKKKKRNKDGFYVFPVTTYHDLNHLFAGRTFPKCI